MKLHYFHGRSPLKALVMVRREHRLELFIKPVGEGAWALVALTGPDRGQPERQHCQGPWRTLARAESVLRSTAGALMGNGYEPCPSDYVVWSVTAQRLARNIRTDQGAGAARTTLDPDQFEPIA
ncbi:hypothetical protein QQF73_01395 [Marinobacter sp. M216]|uniref:Uncharacterized protein n=1 Tax=Marinobacter albus TaxID=3030833 RepID=A0ABT7H7C8_9GAMM|nr:MULTISPECIES: hypothetical protein [unclassified Marinobacter]MBW7471460.1 hypothetical protein [Marinobacter sp. F4218]MDK9556262.1 hypothetical protein [Marinobacter sp. M216]